MILQTPRTITKLALSDHQNLLIPFFSIWLVLTFTVFPKITPLLFLVTNWKKQSILFFLPFIILLIYLLIYYFWIFQKITICNQRYFFSIPGIDENNFAKSPKLILNENFETRFSFKIKIYGNEVSEFEKHERYAIIFEKARSIEIDIKRTNDVLNQSEPKKFGNGRFVCIEQDYELFSTLIDFFVYMATDDAENTEGLKIYLEYGNIIEKIENNPSYRPTNLITEQDIFLAR